MLRLKPKVLSYAIGVLLFATPNTLYSEESDRLPAALLCSVSDQTVIVYLSRFNADGSAQYSSLSGGAVVVNSEGVVEPAATMNPGSCAGRTVQELREAGETREFAPG